jgi:hypothetical protein
LYACSSRCCLHRLRELLEALLICCVIDCCCTARSCTSPSGVSWPNSSTSPDRSGCPGCGLRLLLRLLLLLQVAGELRVLPARELELRLQLGGVDDRRLR